MARVVCQITKVSQTLSVRWSQDDTFFEPYQIDESSTLAVTQTGESAKRALQNLTSACDNSDENAIRQVAFQLAQHGHQLYQGLLPDTNLGREIRTWLAKLYDDGALRSLEIVGDISIEIPWQVVYEPQPEESSFQSLEPFNETWRNFWGIRYCLSQTHSYNPLLKVDLMDSPEVLIVVDEAVQKQFSAEIQEQLSAFFEMQEFTIIDNVTALKTHLKKAVPDLLHFICDVNESAIILGRESIPLEDLKQTIQGNETAQSPWNNVLLSVQPTTKSKDTWTAFRTQLEACRFSGLICPTSPLPAKTVGQFSLDFLEKFLAEGTPLGEVVQNCRSKYAPAGLVLESQCPSRLQVSWENEGTSEHKEDDDDSEEDEVGLPESPFRPFIPCELVDRPLFVARENDVNLLAGKVTSDNTQVTFLHGRSGVGKGSLLRAGLLSALDSEVHGYRVLCDRTDEEETEAEHPAMFIQATNDLPFQLAMAVCAFAVKPFRYNTPTGREVTVDLLTIMEEVFSVTETSTNEHITTKTETSSAISDSPGGKSENGNGDDTDEDEEADPQAVCDLLTEEPNRFAELLRVWNQRLPFSLVIIIEHGEDIFTMTRTRTDVANRNSGVEILSRFLTVSGEAKLIISLRTEYLGRWLARFPDHPTNRWQECLLPGMNVSQLTQVLDRTASTETSPYAQLAPVDFYKFKFEPGLTEHIAKEALRAANEGKEEALPLLQALGDRLFALVANREDKTITSADLDAVGGIAGGTTAYAEQLLSGLFQRDSRIVQDVFRTMFIRQADGTLHRLTFSAEELSRFWLGKMEFSEVLQHCCNPEVRLLQETVIREDDEVVERYSLGHDSLAPVAANWEEASKRKVQFVDGIKESLWYLIPMAMLACTITWFFTSSNVTNKLEKKHKSQLEQAEKREEVLVNAFNKRLADNRNDFFLGDLLKAQQAANHHNPKLTLELLQKYKHPGMNFEQRDLFGWLYLWQKIHQENWANQDHQSPILCMALTDSKHLLASGDGNGGIFLGDTSEKGTLKRRLIGTGTEIQAIGLSSDGRWLVASANDGKMNVFDLETKSDSPTYIPEKHSKPVRAIEMFREDGKFASAGEDGEIHIWGLESRKVERSFVGNKTAIHCLAVSPDGKWLVSADADNQITVWNVTTGKPKRSFQATKGLVQDLAISPDGKLIVLAGKQVDKSFPSGILEFRNSEFGTPEGKPIFYPNVISSVVFADNSTVITGSQDGMIHYWKIGESEKPAQTILAHALNVNCLAISDDGKTFYSGSDDFNLKQWQRNRKPDFITAHKGPARSLAVSPDDQFIATGGDDGKLRLWDMESGVMLSDLHEHEGSVTALAMTKRKDKFLLASGSWDKEDGELILWEAKKPGKDKVIQFKKKAVLKGHDKGITAVAFSPTGDVLASASEDATIKLWDPEEGKELQTLSKKHSGPIYCVAFSSDGKQLASGGEEKILYFWNKANSGNWEFQRIGQNNESGGLLGSTGAIRHVQFDFREGYVVSAGEDGKIRFWNPQQGDENPPLVVGSPIYSLYMTPSLLSFVTANSDSALHVMDYDLQRERFQFRGHDGPVYAVTATSDRSVILSAGHDGKVHFWRISR